MNNAQKKMWQAIKDQDLKGHRFTRHVLVEPFIVDFACVQDKIIVEVDDSASVEHQNYQRYRTEYLQNKGFLVLRFWYQDVMANITEVLSSLKRQL